MGAEVFISYSSLDRDRVMPVVESLRGNGISVWVDEGNIHAADLWSEQTVQAIAAVVALLVARREGVVAPAAVRGRSVAGLSALDQERWDQVLAHAGDPEQWRRLEGAGPVLRDDQPLLDELLLESYVVDDDPEELLAAAGVRKLADAEQLAYEANQRGAWSDAIAALEECQQASAFLRLQAGDARWYLRQLTSAALEYRAGLELSPPDDLRRKLEARAAALRVEREPLLAAQAAAARTWWFSALVVLAGALAVLLLRRI